MNNLIIGTPRSGTTSLYNSIVTNSSEGYNEPFNPYNNNFFVWNKFKNSLESSLELHKNFTVKTICAQFPIGIDEDNMIAFYKELIPLFDNVIFLDRRDIEDHYKSWCNLRAGQEKGGVSTAHKKYVLDNNVISLKHLDYFVYFKHIFLKIVEEFNSKVFYYEDLYFNCQEETYKEMKLNYTEHAKNTLHPNRKYRQEKTTNFLI